MTRLSAARLLSLLAILVGMLGCELSPPLVPLEASPSPSASLAPTASPAAAASTPAPTATPAVTAIRGNVIDRNGQPLPGARVAVGALSVLTAQASASVVDEAGESVELAAGEFILLRVPAGDRNLELSYDDATNSIPVTVQASGVTRADNLYLDAYGAVPSGSHAIVASYPLPLIKVQKASADAALAFSPETVGVSFKAPPNGSGDQIGAYSVTYYQGDGTLLAPPVVYNCALSVPPATSATRSGAYVSGTFDIVDYDATLRSAWTSSNAAGYLRLAFFDKRGGRPILGYDGEPLVVELSCTLAP